MNFVNKIILLLVILIAIILLGSLQLIEPFEERIADVTQRCTNKTTSPMNYSCPSSNLSFSPLYDANNNLVSNVLLLPGQKITSPSGSIELIFMKDGNLVLQLNNFDGTYIKLWQSDTFLCPTGDLISDDELNYYCQSNVDSYNYYNRIEYTKDEYNNHQTITSMPVKLIIDSDGNLKLLDSSNSLVKNLSNVSTTVTDPTNIKLQIRDDGFMYLVKNGITLWKAGTQILLDS